MYKIKKTPQNNERKILALQDNSSFGIRQECRLQLGNTGLDSSFRPAEQEQEAKILKLPGSVLISTVSTHAINEY